jgi:5-methylcytosine-specific restriction endonuclease McrA
MTREEKMRFYHSSAWKEMSKYIMRRDHRECQECGKRVRQAAAEGVLLPALDRKVRRATQVHHIVPYEVRPDLGLDEDNLEAICDKCHNLLHGRTWKQLQKPKKKYATEEKW